MNVVRALIAWVSGTPIEQSLVRHGRRYLADFYDASREAEVRPFLMWGTLLGYLREGRLLPWDGDLDVGLLFEDHARKPQLAAAMARRGYRLAEVGPYKFRFIHRFHGLWIDVDVFFPWRGGMVCCCPRKSGKIGAERFPADAFAELRAVTFLDGIGVWIPSPPEPVLEAIYGDWQTPNRDHPGSLTHFEVDPGPDEPRPGEPRPDEPRPDGRWQV